ncbi:MAG: hypothetical protein GY788_08755 [bacterium]|nr:hypothetical protein [bacterium]
MAATTALGQDWPDLVGTWTGTSRTVVWGEGGHFLDSGADTPGFLESDLTIEWTDAKDGRYVGTPTSTAHTERKLGIMSRDGVSFYTVDRDGFSNGRIIDTDHFELCYLQTDHQIPQMVASCLTFTRQE